MVVKDLPRAVAFYRDVLGMKFLFQAPPALAFFDCGGVRLMLDAAAEGEFNHPGSILYYKVPDVEASYRTLSAKGVAFRDQPHVVHRAPTYELWMAFFTDSEGNFAALMAEKPI